MSSVAGGFCVTNPVFSSGLKIDIMGSTPSLQSSSIPNKKSLSASKPYISKLRTHPVPPHNLTEFLSAAKYCCSLFRA